jgi:hypothetical protein
MFIYARGKKHSTPLLGASNTKVHWVGNSIWFCTNDALAPVQEMPMLWETTELIVSITCRNHVA